MMICGMLPSSAITFNLSIVSELPTISSSFLGRYFSTQGISYPSASLNLLSGALPFPLEEDARVVAEKEDGTGGWMASR
jgi:hypothetical protein